MTTKAFTVSAKSGNLISPKGRLSYVHLLAVNPKSKPTKDGKLKYTTSFLLPPDCDFTLAKQKVTDAAREKWGVKMDDENFRKALRLPFLKAEEKGYDAATFKGWVLIRLTSTSKPQVVDANNADVLEPRDLYAGRWARISMNPFVYDTDGNRGVSFGVVNVQLLEHDEPMSGRPVANDEFEKVEVAGDTNAGAKSIFDD